ncbi:hypothetical protein C0431_14420 [bacterium]|nr:hypothetical protein [bacterium]
MATTQDTFAPKIPTNIRQFHGLLEEIWQNPNQDWNLVECAHAAHYSQFHFSRLFRSLLQMGFKEYVIECRIRRAAYLICNEDHSMQKIMEEVAFSSQNALRNSLRNTLGFSRAELINCKKYLNSV